MKNKILSIKSHHQIFGQNLLQIDKSHSRILFAQNTYFLSTSSHYLYPPHLIRYPYSFILLYKIIKKHKTKYFQNYFTSFLLFLSYFIFYCQTNISYFLSKINSNLSLKNTSCIFIKNKSNLYKKNKKKRFRIPQKSNST